TLADPEPLRRAARRRGVEEARSKATELAEAAGVRLGHVMSIEEGAALSAYPTVPGLGACQAI
ncbi:MAG TPA: SIMPL domain-containing protein, partial [Acidimicrobiales bacterium]|nr:SIMPL domain-containing protein [Acidimicrobiales bacterium]